MKINSAKLVLAKLDKNTQLIWVGLSLAWSGSICISVIQQALYWPVESVESLVNNSLLQCYTYPTNWAKIVPCSHLQNQQTWVKNIHLHLLFHTYIHLIYCSIPGINWWCLHCTFGSCVSEGLSEVIVPHYHLQQLHGHLHH